MTTRGMSLERVEWHLWNWEGWMHGGARVGSPHRKRASGGFINGNSDDFDEMVARADAHCAEVTDLAVDELPVLQRLAVHHMHLASVYRFADRDLHYAQAKLTLCRALPAKGIE